MEKAEDQLLVIFGASGDLTGRKLLPSLYELSLRGLLPEHFCVLGAARTDFSDEEYRAEERKHILDSYSGKDTDQKKLDEFLNCIYYISFESTESSAYPLLKQKILKIQKENNLPDRIIYYLATPPMMYEIVPQCLLENKMNVPTEKGGWRRIVVEKPFGTSLESAEKLNRHLENIFKEENIYRIDHYLGKETVQNILVLRFSNGIFEPLWNRNYIDSVEIRAYESIGVENRGRYYDTAGALRDMIQNHLMQLMAFTAMEPLATFEPEAIRNEVVKVISSIRPYHLLNIDTDIIRAQYDGYQEENSVAPDSTTETYIAMKLFIDNWRWSDVPFYFYTGKKLTEKRSEIVINFKSTPHLLFVGQCSGTSCNQLIIRIQPNEGISLIFGLKVPGEGFTVERVSMDFSYASLSNVTLPDAYERLLLDAMLGDSTLYSRSDALEASWKIIDPILNRWKIKGKDGLLHYAPETDGPEERKTLQETNLLCGS